MLNHNNQEEYRDPINYDLEFGGETDKYDFFLQLAKKHPGHVLELACGTGLTTLYLAERGIRITGVDIVEPMLAYARIKAKELPVDFIEADARIFESNQRYSMIYLTGNAFQAFLSDEDQTALLRTIYKHLEPDGIFAFEMRNPDGTDLSDEEEESWGTFTDMDGATVKVSGTQTYDASKQLMHWVTFRDWGHRQTTSRIVCRFTDVQTLKQLLDKQGFILEHQYANWDQTSFQPSSPMVISVCKKV
ncbi:methyltransferase domain-containing protein [Paenibacillus barcinonensis]|uniref:Methyltransferase domain-containing protein n=1 Tax=Paenibacillus barcinonensis TaxID=198119 RepID=A0A2V4VP17_PAEBA|nr:class I SAM-dependent methyltransferase [Paenibacillus barcinonensis]PYE48052.1 methyltransferase family protein [Paenibacillus barcinonensis]QKS55165.1 methyltransferase domain-containing protein [Paenibacillus barcinonensis]